MGVVGHFHRRWFPEIEGPVPEERGNLVRTNGIEGWHGSSATIDARLLVPFVALNDDGPSVRESAGVIIDRKEDVAEPGNPGSGPGSWELSPHLTDQVGTALDQALTARDQAASELLGCKSSSAAESPVKGQGT